MGLFMEEKNMLSSYAIFSFGGKQYQAVEGKTLAVEKIEKNPGETVVFEQVLLVKQNEGEVHIGKPLVANAKINAEIVSQTKGPKLIVFKFKKRKRLRVKNGHRQPLTVVRFTSIQA